MKALVLAAGRGTRMSPLTRTRPKPLLPVGDSTLLERCLDAAAPYVDGYVVVVGYRGDDVRRAVGDEHRGLPVTYVEQEERMGTGDAVLRAEREVGDRFLVFNGDLYFDAGAVEDVVRSRSNVVSVVEVDRPEEYGVVAVDGGTAAEIVEKPDEPPSNLANAGVYAFTSEVFDRLRDVEPSARGEIEVTDAIAAMIDGGVEFDVVEIDGSWKDVGYPWDLLSANRAWLDDVERRVEGDVADSAVVDGDVVVEEGAVVREGSVVEGPAYLAEDVDVGPNAYVRGGSVLLDGARVGHAVEVKASLLLEGATAAHLSYVGDSVLAEDVNLGAGTVTANLRHDGREVVAHVNGEEVGTGMRKLGAVLGARAKTGVNTSLDAGVRLGPGETTAPGEAVTRDRGVEV
ncbi:MAG: bifunctional sugar-1-phosphate nucleotidylyltransferase/acetyltransferase [Halobacteriales archaeon]